MAYNSDIAAMFEWFNGEANFADIKALRKLNPNLLSFKDWAHKSLQNQANQKP